MWYCSEKSILAKQTNDSIYFSVIYKFFFELIKGYFQYQRTGSDTENYWSVWCHTHYDVTNKNNNFSLSVTCGRSVLFSRLWVQILFYTTLCDKVCQWLVTGQWFSSDTPVSSTNKTESHDITEILLKVASNTINQPSVLKVST